MTDKAKQRLCIFGLMLVAAGLWYQITSAQEEAYRACVAAGVMSNETCKAYTR